MREDEALFAELRLDANEWIAERGTQALVDEMRHAIDNERRIKLGTTNTIIVLRHIDSLEEKARDEYERGYDEGADSVWALIVCSVCGINHDQDESAACDGCEPVTLDQFRIVAGRDRRAALEGS